MIPRIHQAAQAELFKAIDWYEERQLVLGQSLHAAYRAARDEIAHSPFGSERIEEFLPRQVRQFMMKRFPYSIIYEVLDAEIVILAIAHTSRRPLYWSPRRADP